MKTGRDRWPGMHTSHTTIACVVLFMAAIGRVDAEDSARIFNLSIANGKLTAPSSVVRVEQGDAVELRWTADKPTAIELHGYEIKANITPPERAIMKFRATIAGRFQIHADGGGRRHATILYLEVHPK